MDYYAEKIKPLLIEIEKRIPYCKKCNNGFIDKGYDEDNHILISEKCECLKKRIRYKKFIKSGIPEYYWEFFDIEFKQFPKVINKLIDEKKSAIFTGTSFTGKTVAATHILMNKLENSDITGYWWKFSNLITLYYQKRFDEEIYSYLEASINSDIVVIDDLGWSDIKDQNYLITQSMKIIRGMFENGVTVILTTNYPKNDIMEVFGEPLTNSIFHENNISLRFTKSYK